MLYWPFGYRFWARDRSLLLSGQVLNWAGSESSTLLQRDSLTGVLEEDPHVHATISPGGNQPTSGMGSPLALEVNIPEFES